MKDKVLGILAYGPRAARDDVLLALVARVFHLSKLMQARDLGGAYNLNILLETATGPYVLRAYRPWVLDERLVFLQHTKHIIQRSGLPVPLPLSSSTGETFVRHADRLVEVEPFITSDAVVDTWERCALACSSLGKLHTVLASPEVTMLPITPPAHSNYATPAILLEWTRRSIEQIHAQSSISSVPGVQCALDLCTITIELLSSLQTWWEHDGGLTLPQQLTHGDYKGDNMLLLREQVVALLDFDFLGMRERIFDLAYLLYWMLLCFEDMRRPAQLPWSRTATMLVYYNSTAQQPLTDEERRALPLEIARVPLYWIGEAHFLPDTVSAVTKLATPVQFSRWVLAHWDELADLFSKKP